MCVCVCVCVCVNVSVCVCVCEREREREFVISVYRASNWYGYLKAREGGRKGEGGEGREREQEHKTAPKTAWMYLAYNVHMHVSASLYLSL